MNQRSYLDWDRGDARREVNLPAAIYRKDGIRTSGLVSDLSYSGCQVRSSGGLTVGEEITIVILDRGAEALATVRWVTGKRSGLSFSDSTASGQNHTLGFR